MQLNPIFPLHVSKSRMTPTLTGNIVVFCALAKKFLSERIMKMKREKAILLGIFMIMFEYGEAIRFKVLTQNYSYL